jgi:hypothetical protein
VIASFVDEPGWLREEEEEGRGLKLQRLPFSCRYVLRLATREARPRQWPPQLATEPDAPASDPIRSPPPICATPAECIRTSDLSFALPSLLLYLFSSQWPMVVTDYSRPIHNF